jgi:hypothetical protein
MRKHASVAIMAAVLLTAIVTITIYAVDRANAQGNETSAAGGEEHNMTNAAGGEEHNMTNAAGGEEHNMTNATGGPLENISLSTSRTHVEVPPAASSCSGTAGGPVQCHHPTGEGTASGGPVQ